MNVSSRHNTSIVALLYVLEPLAASLPLFHDTCTILVLDMLVCFKPQPIDVGIQMRTY